LPPSDDDGDRFVELFRGGDPGTWECASTWARGAIRHVNVRFSADDVDDLAAKVLEEVWAYVLAGKPVHTPRAFVSHVAKMRALDLLRPKRFYVEIDPSLPDPTPDPYMQAMQADQSSWLRHVLQRLPADEQDLIRMRWFEDQSYKKIAVLLGRPEARLRYEMHAILVKIRRQIRH
jgi:RNA polymerase sigma-70 factor (ECF subfamily)